MTSKKGNLRVSNGFYKTKSGKLAYVTKKGTKIDVKRFSVALSSVIVSVWITVSGISYSVDVLSDKLDDIFNSNDEYIETFVVEPELPLSLNIKDDVEDEEVRPVQFYNVSKGDTLTSIAAKTGVTVEFLKLQNNLNSDVIYIGQELNVGSALSFDVNEAFSSVNLNYVAKPGDTINKLLLEYEFNYELFKDINNIESTDLYTGKNYILPINNYRVDNLTERAIDYRITMANINGKITDNYQGLKINDGVDNTEWIKMGYKYNIDPLFLMAVSTFETGHFQSDAYCKFNNVAGIRYSADPNIVSLGTFNEGFGEFAKYKTVNDSIADLAFIMGSVNRNYDRYSIEEIGKVYAPIHDESSVFEKDLNGNWINGIAKVYESLKSNIELNNAIDECIKVIHGSYYDFEDVELYSRAKTM